MNTRTQYIYWALIAALVGVAVWLWWSQQEIRRANASLQEQLSYTEIQVTDLADRLAQKEEQVEVHKELLRIVRQQSNSTAYDFSQIRTMVAQATQTVEDIKKLEEADGELLAKYSKVYFLNEHYVPENLTYIPSEHVFSDRNLQIKGEVRPFLLEMLNRMEAEGLSPRVISAYRSYDYQEDLKHRHSVTYGTSVANQFVADQGYSEHQLGTTVDFVNTDIGTNMIAFDTTPEYQWLLENAHMYGFILSYPEDNEYYEFEPWHWRFVGTELATRLYEENEQFYALPQREINTYRINMFDK